MGIFVLPNSGTVTNVTGAPDRITVVNGTTTPVVDISATFEALLGKVASPLSQFAATTSLELRGVISDPTGAGSLVFADTPTLVTPVLGVATATSINKVIFTAPATTATLTLANNTTTSITGGGTLGLGGFNLTITASGTAALLGANNTFTQNQEISLATNGTVSLVVRNPNTGGAANSYLLATNNTCNLYQQMLGTNYTTAGLLVPNLALVSTNSTVGSLYLSTVANTYHKWAIGGTAAGNQIMNLLTTGLSLTPTTLTDGTNALSVTATMPTVITGTSNGINFSITGAGSSSQVNRGMIVSYAAGYTGSGQTTGLVATNSNAGTGGGYGITSNVLNQGLSATCTATTTGTNLAGLYIAQGGDKSISIVGKSIVAKNNATNGGAIFVGNNTGTTPTHFGVYAGLNATDPTFVSAALIADNSSTTDPIALFRDNGAVVISHIDGGLSFFGGSTTPTAIVHIGASTTARASLNIVSGTAPTSPNDGDIWNDGSDLKVRLGGVTYTLTKV